MPTPFDFTSPPTPPPESGYSIVAEQHIEQITTLANRTVQPTVLANVTVETQLYIDSQAMRTMFAREIPFKAPLLCDSPIDPAHLAVTYDLATPPPPEMRLQKAGNVRKMGKFHP